MHSMAAMIIMGAALLGQPGGVTESELPPPGASRVIEQAPREIIPETPQVSPAPPAQAQAPAAPRTEDRGGSSARPVAAFWFVLQGG
jgi:hypothetical protein